MTRLLLTLLILFSTTTYGQNATNIKKKAKEFQDSLMRNNIDTMLEYTLECVGYYSTDTCKLFDGHFFLWKQNDKTFLKRIDDCNIYKAVLLDTINPLTFYVSQKKNIDREIIYPPTYIQSKHGESETAISLYIDHTCYTEITTTIKAKKTFKRVSDYNLTFEKFDNGRKNIYYNYNQKTKLKKLVEDMAQLVQQINRDKKFEVE